MVCEMKLANLGILTEYKEERKNITGERRGTNSAWYQVECVLGAYIQSAVGTSV